MISILQNKGPEAGEGKRGWRMNAWVVIELGLRPVILDFPAEDIPCDTAEGTEQ